MSNQRRYQTLPNLRALKRKKAKEREGGGLFDGLFSGAGAALSRNAGARGSRIGGAFSFLGGGGGVLGRREGSYSFYRRRPHSTPEEPVPQLQRTPRPVDSGYSQGHGTGHPTPYQQHEDTPRRRFTTHVVSPSDWEEERNVSLPLWDWMKVSAAAWPRPTQLPLSAV